MPSPVPLELAWELLLALAARARGLRAFCGQGGFAWRAGRWCEVPEREAELWVDATRHRAQGASRDAEPVFALMLPLVSGERASSLVVGQLCQSLDGRVVRPRAEPLHVHRLRALFDAVIVGVDTVRCDDVRLGTRVPGPQPTRVVLDPDGELRGPCALLEDGVASTLVIHARERLEGRVRLGHAEWVGVPCHDGHFDLAVLRAVLRERGLARLFVEGGSETVARFLAAHALDRLHVRVAPVVLGHHAPSSAAPPLALDAGCRSFALGDDVLYDCALRPPRSCASWASEPGSRRYRRSSPRPTSGVARGLACPPREGS